jgi:hypothetical protein
MCYRRTRLSCFVVMIFFIAVAVSAQDIDRKKVAVSYIVLPLQRIPETVETYAVTIKAKESSWGNTLGNIYEAQKILLNGYHRLPGTEDADLVIAVDVINGAIFDGGSAESTELTYKRDKNSPEIKYIAWYYNFSFYTPKIGYRAYTRDGRNVFEGTLGGELKTRSYGATDYDNHYRSSQAVSYAFEQAKRGEMSSAERSNYNDVIGRVPGIVMAYSMYRSTETFTAKYVDEKKGRTEYLDLRDALNYFEQAVETLQTDNVSLINKFVQPDVEKRKELMGKAIAIWEKALSEADYENKKARIDSKVARHIYYNLTLAYLWIDDFVKAREYAQGRKKDVGSWDKNFLSGIRILSDFIDNRARRHEANNWRKPMVADENQYMYKDAVQRAKEKAELMAKADKARTDSLKALKTSTKKTPVKKSTQRNTGTAAGGSTQKNVVKAQP